jgi:hypothetical protein
MLDTCSNWFRSLVDRVSSLENSGLAELPDVGFTDPLQEGEGIWWDEQKQRWVNRAPSTLQSYWSANGDDIYNNNAGNVGIGVTYPGTALDINGDLTIRGGGIEGGQINLWNAATTASAAIIDVGGTNAFRIFPANADYNMYIGHITGAGSGSQLYYTAGAERMRITSAGRVGIGTTSPGVQLQVTASAGGLARFTTSSTQGLLYIEDTNTTAYNNWIGSSGNTIKFGTSNAERMRLGSTGNLGIGTTNPPQTLSVGSAAGTKLVVSDTASFGTPTTVASFFGTGDYQCTIGANSSFGVDIGRNATSGIIDFNCVQNGIDSFSWSQAGTERMRINSNGTVNIAAFAGGGNRAVMVDNNGDLYVV